MGRYVGKQTIKKIIATGKSPRESRILVMGITFKEDVTDIRNSKVVDIINEMKDFGANVEVIDPGADAQEVRHEYGLELSKEPSGLYDAVIAAVSHKEYTGLDESYFASMLVPGGVLVDIKGIYRKKVKNLNYWSL